MNTPATAAAQRMAAGPSGPAGGNGDGGGDDAATSVVSLYVKQQQIYARAVSGWFAGWRWALVFFSSRRRHTR